MACRTPRQAMNHLLSNNPELAKRDTSYKSLNDTLKGYSGDFSFEIDTLTWKSNMKNDAKETFDNPVPSRNYYGIFIKDTLIKVQERITVKLWQNGSELKVGIIERDTIKPITVPVAITSIDQNPCAHEMTPADYFYRAGFYIELGLLLLVIAGLIFVK